jgi:hypothetical protein
MCGVYGQRTLCSKTCLRYKWPGRRDRNAMRTASLLLAPVLFASTFTCLPISVLQSPAGGGYSSFRKPSHPHPHLIPTSSHSFAGEPQPRNQATGRRRRFLVLCRHRIIITTTTVPAAGQSRASSPSFWQLRGDSECDEKRSQSFPLCSHQTCDV